VALVEHLIAQAEVHVTVMAMMTAHVELADARVIQRLAAVVPRLERPADIDVHLFAARQMAHIGLQRNQFGLIVGVGKLVEMLLAAIVDALLQGQRPLMRGTVYRIARDGLRIEPAAVVTVAAGAGVAVVTRRMEQRAAFLHRVHAGILEFVVLHGLHLRGQIGIARHRLFPGRRRQRQQRDRGEQQTPHRSVTR